MAEGQRYFDLRRCKDAEVEESKKNYGCNFSMSDTEEQREQFYTPIQIADLPTAFSRKLYFWPDVYKRQIYNGDKDIKTSVGQVNGWNHFSLF